MAYDDLSSLISSLEYGTNLHISVVFSNHCGNEKTQLPFSQKIHKCPVCDAAKTAPGDFAACFRCRNIVLNAVRSRKKPLQGLCTKGVYEYVHPVVRSGKTVAVVFIGNILTGSETQLSKLQSRIPNPPLDTMQPDCSPAQCAQIAALVDSYIQFLIEKYGSREISSDRLLLDIKTYLAEHFIYDLSVSQLAAEFGYNEKYLGRLFKASTGQSVREYCNGLRIIRAKHLLRSTDLQVSAIATQVGYNNINYFNRIFKASTGVTPLAYRSASNEYQ